MRVSPDEKGIINQSSAEPNTVRVRVSPVPTSDSGISPAADDTGSSDWIDNDSAGDSRSVYDENKRTEDSGLTENSEEYIGTWDDEGGNDVANTWEYNSHDGPLAAETEQSPGEEEPSWSADTQGVDPNYQAISGSSAYVDGTGNFIDWIEGADGHDSTRMHEAEGEGVEVDRADALLTGNDGGEGGGGNATGTWEYNSHDEPLAVETEQSPGEEEPSWSADTQGVDPNYQAISGSSAYVDGTGNLIDWTEGANGHDSTRMHEAEGEGVEVDRADAPSNAEPNRGESNVSYEPDNSGLGNKNIEPEVESSAEPEVKPMVFEAKEGGPSVAEAHYAFEANGWSQGFSEEGHEYWTHNMTGETRWVAYMSEFLTQKQGEGLGEIGTADDFTETPWVPPRIDEAEVKGRESSFENGNSPLWITDISSFGVWGSGVRLYFVFIRALSIIFAGMSLCYIPAILLMSSGNATSNSARDALGFWRYQLSNIGAGEQADAGLFTEQIEFLGGQFYVSDVGLPLSLFTLLAGFVGLVGWFYLRSETTTVVNEYLHDVISLSDYSVFITNVPSDVSSEKLTKWLSSKFDLRGLDWKGRDKTEEVGDDGNVKRIPHESLYGRHHDCRVRTSAHLTGRRDEFILGSGLAEVRLFPSTHAYDLLNLSFISYFFHYICRLY